MAAKRAVFKCMESIPGGLLKNSWPGGEGGKRGYSSCRLDRAEPEKYDLGKTMILFIFLGWRGLGRHWLRLMASFIIPRCSIKFYSLHLQSK